MLGAALNTLWVITVRGGQNYSSSNFVAYTMQRLHFLSKPNSKVIVLLDDNVIFKRTALLCSFSCCFYSRGGVVGRAETEGLSSR